MTQNETVGKNISLFRARLGLSQDEVADYLGIARPLLSYYETGSRNIPTEIISKSARLFGVEEYDLFDTDQENADIRLAFAFRAGSLDKEDLGQIADFKKIVLNYLNMKKVITDASGIA